MAIEWVKDGLTSSYYSQQLVLLEVWESALVSLWFARVCVGPGDPTEGQGLTWSGAFLSEQEAKSRAEEVYEWARAKLNA